MRISSISILDTFGTRTAKFAPGSVTRITGPNGSGKSSILRALSKVFEGGSDPSIIRNGAEKSVVEITLDDGTVITRTTAPVKRRKGEDAGAPTRFRTDVEILDSDGTPRGAPQTYLNELSESVAVDPGQILRIDATTALGKKQLAEILLRIMPIRFEPDEITQALAATVPGGAGSRSSISRLDDALVLPTLDTALDLDGLKAYGYKVTEQRRRIGQTRDDSDGAINRLQKSLPEDDGTDYGSALAQAENRRREIDKAIADRRLEIEQMKSGALADAKAQLSNAVGDIEKEFQDKLREIERQRADKTVEANAAFGSQRAAIDEAAAGHLRALADESAPLVQEVTGDIASLKEKASAAQRSVTLKQELEVQTVAHRAASRQYEQLTEVLARIEKLRSDKLDSLPVAGLEVSGEQVLIDGVPWQNVNTARRVEVSLQLCALRSGKLGILFLDNAESLDEETRKALEQQIAASGFQLIEAIVSGDSSLTIETFEPVAA